MSRSCERRLWHAVRKVGEQGEGFDLPPASNTESESHFERFFAIYKLFKELSESSAVPRHVAGSGKPEHDAGAAKGAEHDAHGGGGRRGAGGQRSHHASARPALGAAFQSALPDAARLPLTFPAGRSTALRTARPATSSATGRRAAFCSSGPSTRCGG